MKRNRIVLGLVLFAFVAALAGGIAHDHSGHLINSPDDCVACHFVKSFSGSPLVAVYVTAILPLLGLLIFAPSVSPFREVESTVFGRAPPALPTA